MNSPIKVVIVEDELISAEFLKEILEQHGAEILEIVDKGAKAIEICTTLNPDVVFMDIMLKDNISGSEAAVIISQRCNAKIIFLTAYVDDEMVDYAVESRAVAYLTKPYNEAQIIATLRLAMRKDDTHLKMQSSNSRLVKIALIDGYIYDTEEKRLFKEEREVALGVKALKLIDILCATPGLSVSTEQIELSVWGELVNDKTLRSLIFRIRAMTDSKLIENISKTGYRIRLKEE